MKRQRDQLYNLIFSACMTARVYTGQPVRIIEGIYLRMFLRCSAERVPTDAVMSDDICRARQGLSRPPVAGCFSRTDLTRIMP